MYIFQTLYSMADVCAGAIVCIIMYSFNGHCSACSCSTTRTPMLATIVPMREVCSFLSCDARPSVALPCDNPASWSSLFDEYVGRVSPNVAALSISLLASSRHLHEHRLRRHHHFLPSEESAHRDREAGRSSLRYHLLVAVVGLLG